jgi:hypothetical protein
MECQRRVGGVRLLVSRPVSCPVNCPARCPDSLGPVKCIKCRVHGASFKEQTLRSDYERYARLREKRVLRDRNRMTARLGWSVN